jgi:hypothetical protein
MGHMYHSRFSDTQDVGVPQIKVKENDSEGDYHRAFLFRESSLSRDYPQQYYLNLDFNSTHHGFSRCDEGRER